MAKTYKSAPKHSVGKFLFVATFFMMIFATQFVMSHDSDQSLSLMHGYQMDKSLVTEALHFVVRALTYSLDM